MWRGQGRICKYIARNHTFSQNKLKMKQRWVHTCLVYWIIIMKYKTGELLHWVLLWVSHLQTFSFSSPAATSSHSKNNMHKGSLKYKENSLNMSLCKCSASLSFLSLSNLLKVEHIPSLTLSLCSPLSLVWQPNSAPTTPYKNCS